MSVGVLVAVAIGTAVGVGVLVCVAEAWGVEVKVIVGEVIATLVAEGSAVNVTGDVGASTSVGGKLTVGVADSAQAARRLRSIRTPTHLYCGICRSLLFGWISAVTDDFIHRPERWANPSLPRSDSGAVQGTGVYDAVHSSFYFSHYRTADECRPAPITMTSSAANYQSQRHWGSGFHKRPLGFQINVFGT